jgi:hypothetical protein
LTKREELDFDTHLQEHFQNIRKISFETIISTQSNQIAITSGNFIKKWEENNRNYYQYKTSTKINPSIAYFSASYTTKNENYKGVSIEQYYNKTDSFNINNIQQNSKIALDYCTNNFGPYPFNHLRIAEIPSHWQFGGFAHPGMISMVEDRLYLIDQRNELNFDLVAKRTIHEVAHQWFGHVLTPKNVVGASIFTEGFAKYTEAVILEKKYGLSAIRQLSATANRRYFIGRSNTSEKEPFLSLVKGQGYLSYGKNFTTILALRELIGEDAINKVIKILIDRHKNDITFTATSIEFINELYLVTPIQYHQLIDDWFKRVITYDLSIKNAGIKKLENGYEININISANRLETNSKDHEIPISINEPIQIGFFSKHPDKISSEEEIISLKPYLIDKSNTSLKIRVNDLPAYIVIDPYGTHLDKNLNDNVFYIK